MVKVRFYCVVLAMLAGFWLRGISAQAGSIYSSPYVTFSPDGKAWTTDAGNTDVKWYSMDGSDDVWTGVEGTLRALQVGEHYYEIQRSGQVPVVQWKVNLQAVNCCHNAYPPDEFYHGIDYTKQTCFRPHFSAWKPICADCGQPIADWNFYMSKETAISLGYLYMSKDLDYYYLCPFNRNLEIGTEMGLHTCLSISANRYRVVYDANAQGEVYGGYMAPSYHMYNNATEYEGRSVTPKTCLNSNTYSRIGWEFIGWNTKADGSGSFFAEGAEIMNLCEADYEKDKESGTVRLYAMWKPSESFLEIDPAGGYYAGEAEIVGISGEYGSSLVVNTSEIVPPSGGVITFDTCGGEEIEKMQGTQYFVEWKQSDPFWGNLEENVYYFYGSDGSRDRITAVYANAAVILPKPINENASFGGWYYDREYTKPAGGAGEEFVPLEDVTLYAQWVQLILSSEENYEANDRVGAVDLQWQQSDGVNKTYKLYQCPAGQDWKQIYEADSVEENVSFRMEYQYGGDVQYFTVPYTGFYSIKAYGAQGGDYGAFSGGYGGYVQGSFWLEKGQVLECSIGGRNGYNGGGIGNVYANGGGYTKVSTEDAGTILLAGGGGGAGSSGNGGAGGSEISLVATGHNGENGGAGGGGGYLGGRAGELVVHNHVEGKCNHVHKGSPTIQGGCYTQPVSCGKELEHIYTGSDYWYWGGSDTNYCPNCGADASLGEDCTGHEMEYYDHVCAVHGNQKSNTNALKPSVCEEIAEYGVTCGHTEAYTCGYPYDGYVISSKPAYGGSSYVNVLLARSFEKVSGIRRGDGYLLIEAKDIGYQTVTFLEGVSARDMAAPKTIDLLTVEKYPKDEQTISVYWNKPQDLGTVYYHKAESYLAGETERLSVSNITADTLVSGVRGYLCMVDAQAETEVTWANGQFIYGETQSIVLTEADLYMHIKTVDYAGNCSKTVHIPVGNRLQGSLGVQWPLRTKQLEIEEAENVYLADGSQTYYVKCDGKLPFSVQYEAYIQGPASEQYQINYAVMESVGATEQNVRNTVCVPYAKLDEEESVFQAEYLQFESDGAGYLHNGDYTVALRSERCSNLTVIQEIIPDVSMHGQKIGVMPIAGADCGTTVVYSDYEQDRQNMIWLIGDSEAPIIDGLDVLEELDVLDRRQQDIHLSLTAEDALSGLQDFYLKIENKDNDACATYLPNEDGEIIVDICADEPIFSGDIIITAYAIDNVGNVRKETYGTTEFDLQVSIERILAPHEPVFKRGESGYLYITAWGYAERIEIEFPEELVAANPSLNHVYEYELKGSYMQEETYEFMVPLNVPEGADYTVTVRAYKGDKMLERHPALAVLDVSGTVLDEIRTRLR